MVASTEAVPPRRLRPDVPRNLETICLKCLEKEPQQRYSTAANLADDLHRFLEGRPISARTVSLAGRSWRWCRRNPRLATVSAALAATVVIAAAAFTVITYRHNVQLRAEVRRTQAKAEEARQNYQEARSTIQAMLKRLDDSRLKGVPRLLDLRRSLREDALAFYDQVLRKIDSNDPIVRTDTARALGDAALLQHALGQSELALGSDRRALRLVEGLMSERPDNLEYMALKLDCLLKLAPLLGASKRPADEVIAVCRESVELAARVAKATPDDMHYQESLALCLTNYGNAFLTLKKLPEAMVQYREATKVRKRIDPSKLPGVALRLAQSLSNEGIVLWGHDLAQAENRFKEAALLVLPVPPDDHVSEGDRAYTYGLVMVNWSGVLNDMKRYDDAINRSAAGLKIVEPYLQTEPNDSAVRSASLYLHGNRANALSAKGMHRESAEEWARFLPVVPRACSRPISRQTGHRADLCRQPGPCSGPSPARQGCSGHFQQRLLRPRLHLRPIRDGGPKRPEASAGTTGASHGVSHQRRIALAEISRREGPLQKRRPARARQDGSRPRHPGRHGRIPRDCRSSSSQALIISGANR